MRLHPEGDRATLSNMAIEPQVVGTPQLWQCVAETVSQTTPDVVVLVQRVRPRPAARGQRAAGAAVQTAASAAEQGAADGSAAAALADTQWRTPRQQQQQQQQQHRGVRMHAEDACRMLLASGMAEAVLEGRVGDCCASDAESEDELPAAASMSGTSVAGEASSAPQQQQQQQQQHSIVPLLRRARVATRRAVRAAALGPLPQQPDSSLEEDSGHQYWGVVVQSRSGAAGGAEGAYLLQTVRSEAPTGCTCTHYSLTRISAGGGDLEQQFVRSWLV